MRRPSPARPHAAWWPLSAVLTAAAVPLLLLTSVGPGSAAATAAAVLLVVVQAGSLAFMRAEPERATAVSLAAGVGLQALTPRLGVLGLAGFSLCALAALRPPRVSLWALAAMVALAPLHAIGQGTVGWLVGVGSPVLSWSWGELVRAHRERRRNLARRVVEAERARIARELHDVVAHNVSLIVVQAVAADDVFDAQPAQAREALRAIEASGRSALAELRRLLGAMRPDAAEDGNDPQPGLGRLDALVASVSAAGLKVALRREGTPGHLPAGVDLSAYRIVQEALTNALRHARAEHAAVTVRYGPDEVELEVTDDGRGSGGGEDGHGLVGMRERVALLGGTLEAGDAPRGGFRVRAVLPVGAGS